MATRSARAPRSSRIAINSLSTRFRRSSSISDRCRNAVVAAPRRCLVDASLSRAAGARRRDLRVTLEPLHVERGSAPRLSRDLTKRQTSALEGHQSAVGITDDAGHAAPVAVELGGNRRTRRSASAMMAAANSSTSSARATSSSSRSAAAGAPEAERANRGRCSARSSRTQAARASERSRRSDAVRSSFDSRIPGVSASATATRASAVIETAKRAPRPIFRHTQPGSDAMPGSGS